MRVAVLSDIHANLDALTEALRLCERNKAEAAICLGDVVGYGPDPGPCIDLVRSYCEACVQGNHDEAVATDEGFDFLPKDGRAVARKHRAELSEEHLSWLAALPLRHEAYGATFVHSSPDQPESWRRLGSFQALQSQFAAFETGICFVGHSHVPAIACNQVGVLSVRHGHRFLVDVGSVGQPRDEDSRLAFGLFDSEAFSCELIRGHYEVERTVSRLKKEGLPGGLAQRLRKGI